ncbi:MAG: histidine phosphatase family protein [Actinomycetota bacterium]|nr:histidine phosphatase family protein [Actinomycetota bacterium]
MSLLRYVSHANVDIDARVPVPEWHLSELGRRRTQQMFEQPWIASVARIVSSAETKALDTASMLAEHLGLAVEVRPTTGEIDRSSTGYVTHDRHEQLANELFAFPDRSADGWERAVDAQARIVDALSDLVDGVVNTVVVGHGGVGTLWYCRLTDQPIDRRHDQPGQGHYFTVDTTTRTVLHPWRAIDDFGRPPTH